MFKVVAAGLFVVRLARAGSVLGVCMHECWGWSKFRSIIVHYVGFSVSCGSARGSARGERLVKWE